MKLQKRTFYSTNASLKFETDSPVQCVHCGGYGVPVVTSSTYSNYNGSNYHLMLFRNECCGQMSYAVYKSHAGSGEFLGILPQEEFSCELPESMTAISPRFVELFKQAYHAEQLGYFELAGSGYRNSIEVLIKDFAIQELHQPEKDVIKKKLAKCIEDYLKTPQASISADVLRVLGNDFTHYERKYDSVDFQILKRYLQIFIAQIDCEYLILHPVVPTNPALSPDLNSPQ